MLFINGLPDLSRGGGDLRQDVQGIRSYLLEMTDQIRHTLENIDRDNLSEELDVLLTGMDEAVTALADRVSVMESAYNALEARVTAIGG